MKAVISRLLARPLAEPQLPAGLDVHWFTSTEEAVALAADADGRLVSWITMIRAPGHAAVAAAGKPQWLSDHLCRPPPTHSIPACCGLAARA